MRSKRLVVFAGPNGSGKSSLTRKLIERDLLPTEHIDPDRIAQASGDRSRAATAGALLQAARRREEWLAEGRDFCFETVLSHARWLAFFERARSLGYDVIVYFIGIGDPMINVARVRNRAAHGGHAIPDHVVIERWHRSMDLLPTVATVADRLFVFDNGRSDRAAAVTPVALVERTETGTRTDLFGNTPEWVRRNLLRPPLTPPLPSCSV